MKNCKYLMCDFETTLEEPTRVWLYSITDIEKQEVVNVGYTIEEFLAYIKNFRSICYFHNLRFDGSFIIDWLLKNGYVYQEKVSKVKEFNTLIDVVGTFYSIRVKWSAKGLTYFYDSFKLLPFKVEEIGKSFGGDYTKGDIDFKEVKERGYVANDKDIDYVKRDTLVVAHAIKEVYLNYGQDKMTIGSNALDVYKKQFCPTKFEYVFPQLDSEVDLFCRASYKGGYVYVNPKYQNEWVGEGIVYDNNSMYPYSMTKELPCSKPVYFKGDYDDQPKDVKEFYPMYIQRLRIMCTLKENGLPTIQIKKNLCYNPTEYQREINEITELTLTSIDLELLFDNYDIDYLEMLDGYMFVTTSNLFKRYVETFYEEKRTSTGAKRQRAKLFLNNLYGKMATNPVNLTKVPFLNTDTNSVDYKTLDGEDKKTIYIPVACFITAWARYTLITAIKANIDRFLYCDTDSIHLLGNYPASNIEMDNYKLGAWKEENKFTKAIFIKPKTYAEVDGDDVTIKCCGMPQNIKDEFEKDGRDVNEFKIGFTSDKKLLPKKVDGGVILVPTIFTIK